MFGIGIIGCGKIAQVRHIPEYADHPEAVLLGFYDINQERARELAEKHGIQLALHPDDPPVPRLGDVERIMISRENIRRAVYDILPSEILGITMCQANFYIMGEDLEDTIREFAKKIYLVHFRNTLRTENGFRETFHDNGALDMARLMRIYLECGVDAPIRVDHVPTMAGEVSSLPGYDAMGRLFAIGYLKGILEGVQAT